MRDLESDVALRSSQLLPAVACVRPRGSVDRQASKSLGPGDAWVFDLAYESSADHIVTFDQGVHDVARALGFEAIFPEDSLEGPRRQYEP
jgi:predicted nucleic acid-binding protein